MITEKTAGFVKCWVGVDLGTAANSWSSAKLATLLNSERTSDWATFQKSLEKKFRVVLGFCCVGCLLPEKVQKEKQEQGCS